MHDRTLLRKRLCDHKLAVGFFFVFEGQSDSRLTAFPVFHRRQPQPDPVVVQHVSLLHVLIPAQGEWVMITE